MNKLFKILLAPFILSTACQNSLFILLAVNIMAKEKPNILIIITDKLRYADVINVSK